MPQDIFASPQALVLAASSVMTYPALEIESPTLVIMELIALRGTAGIEIGEFRRRLDSFLRVLPRIQDLLDEGFAALKDGCFEPAANGLIMARVFTAWRRILGAGLGG